MLTRKFQVPLVAAGADWTWTPSIADRIHLCALTGQFVTSNTVVGRQPSLRVKDQTGNVIWSQGSPNIQGPSATLTYCASPSVRTQGAGNAPGYTVISANAANVPVSPGPGVCTGYFVSTVGTAETLTLLDGATAIAAPLVTAVGWFPLNLPFTTSLNYTYAGTTAGSVTLCYQAAQYVAEDGIIELGLPEFDLLPGWTLSTSTGSIQVGDQWQNTYIVYGTRHDYADERQEAMFHQWLASQGV